MPRPPVLPEADWKAVFDSAHDYAAWLGLAEKEENRAAIEGLYADFALTPSAKAYLAAMPRPVYVIAIAEDWCPDVIRHVPILQTMSDVTEHLHVRYVLREEQKDIFIRFLTNGGEAVPKFIFLSQEWVETGSWGPMPLDCKKMIARGRAASNLKGARENVFNMYNADPHRHVVVRELLEEIDIALTETP